MADQKPAGVNAFGVIALSLGIMGVLGGMAGIGALFIPQPAQTQPGMNPKAAEVAAEFQRKMEQFSKDTRGSSLIAIPVMMVLSILLASGGIAALQLKALGLVKVAFGVSLLADTLWAIYGTINQMKMMEIMKWYSKELSGMSNAPGVEMILSVSSYAGIFFGIGWMIAKAAFYIVGLVYFSKPKVKQAFEGGAAPEPQL
jgi:hypothetical protein